MRQTFSEKRTVEKKRNASAAQEAPRRPLAGKPRSKIVVVDDEPDFLDLLQHWLGAKYELELLRSGVGLREELAALEPDLLILDVHMPDKDGFSVCQEIRADKRFSFLPILFLTASKDDVDFMKTLEVGANSYLTKPITGKELDFRIQEILAS